MIKTLETFPDVDETHFTVLRMAFMAPLWLPPCLSAAPLTHPQMPDGLLTVLVSVHLPSPLTLSFPPPLHSLCLVICKLISSFRILQKCPPLCSLSSCPWWTQSPPWHLEQTSEQHLSICIVHYLPSVSPAALKAPRGQGLCFSLQMYGYIFCIPRV